MLLKLLGEQHWMLRVELQTKNSITIMACSQHVLYVWILLMWASKIVTLIIGYVDNASERALALPRVVDILI